MYSVHFYGQMLADTLRMEAYTAALRRAVKRGSVVMDLGCGPGVFAMLACQLGARRVYAVEPENIVGLARETANANGFANQIEFFESMSTEISLAEPAEIIVSDLRGVLPWFQQHLPSIIDARNRLLAPGGILIPQRDVLWAAVVEAFEQYEELVSPWQDKLGLDLSAGEQCVTNMWRKCYLKPEQLLTKPIRWTTIDYSLVDCPNVESEISWRVGQTGTANGVAVWFDSELLDDIGFSNHPAAPKMIYGQGFFPFSRPIPVSAGEQVVVRLSANSVQGDYVWRWDTDFFTGDDQSSLKTNLKQSTFYGVPLSRSQLKPVAE